MFNRYLEKMVRAAEEIRRERAGVYRDNWRFFPVEQLLEAAGYKLRRASLTLPYSREKVLDDILDAVNYICFAYIKLQMEGEGRCRVESRKP